MKIFKNVFIFSVAIISSLFADIETDGWVTLPKPQQRYYEDEGEEDDASIWVVFSKTVDGEKILVRFPEDPRYTHLGDGTLEVSASSETETHLLRVVKEKIENAAEKRMNEISLDPACLLVQIDRSSPSIVDLLYRKEGKWVQEHFRATSRHLYFFQTTSDLLVGEGHRQFIGSFDVETLSKK